VPSTVPPVALRKGAGVFGVAFIPCVNHMTLGLLRCDRRGALRIH
jgi:hypothetical protein